MAASSAGRRYSPDKNEPFYQRSSPTLLALAPSDPQEKQVTEQERREWATVYNHCESRIQALWNWRLNWWNVAGEIARYMKPHRYYRWVETANNYNYGRREDYAIVDRTATLCGDVCAAGMMGGLTDPDSQWAMFGPAIPGFELDQAGQQWYEEIGERYRYILTHSNFYDAQAQHCDDLVFFGTAPAIDYADEKEIINVRTPCSGEYFLGTGFDLSDEVLYEDFRLTVSQLVEGYGVDNLPDDVLKMWRQKGGALEREFVVGHAIEPNFAINQLTGRDEGVGVVPGGFTWREIFWLRGKKDAKPLSMSGFHEQPFAVSRWGVRGNEAYGRGVGENMLGDCIQLQLETRQKAESIEKVNRPPMGADVSLQNLPSSTNPGKITYFNTGANGEKKFFPLYEVKPDIAAIAADIKEVQERLARTAYNQVFQPIQSLRNETRGQVTATEVDALKQEQLMQLGPVIGHVAGTLRLRVRRHLSIMARRGLIPKKPPSLRGVPTKIDLITMLTAAQKATQTAAIARSVQFAGVVSAVYPEARFVIDPEEAVREFNDGVGATSKILRSPQKVKQLIKAEQQQNQAKQALAETQQGAMAAKDLGNASVGPGTALSALVGGAR